MTSSAGDSGIRDAVARLREVVDDLPPAAEKLDARTRRVVEAAGAALDRAGLRQDAHEVRLNGTKMSAIREDAFAEVAHMLLGHVDAIGALLRDAGAGELAERLAELSIDPPPEPAADVHASGQEASLVARHLPDGDAIRRAINQVVARFPPKLQALARTLLFGRSSHAVQRHGHHLRRDHQIARTQWRVDPAGEDHWQLNPDGSADTWRSHGSGQHGVGAASGHYTSPEAVAKPLATLLGAVGRTPAELDRFLDRLADGETTVRVFLRPSDTGITSDDVMMVRGPGTDTKHGEALWRDARDGAMAGYGPPPTVRVYDMVMMGKRPGSLIILVRRPDRPWRLVTSYFFDDRDNLLDYVEL